MNSNRINTRNKILTGLAVAAGLLLVINFFTFSNTARLGYTERFGQAVFPNMEDALSEAKTIHIKVADLSYTLKRAATDGQDWVMIESGNYPVRPERLSQLAEGLIGLRWDQARTSDPEKFKLIGLGDPDHGGNGVRLEIRGTDNALLAELITGRRSDKFYGRRTGEDRSFVLNGSLPPFYTRESWLDLSIVSMLEDVISAVRLKDETGADLYLARPPGGSARSFVPAPPFENDRLISRLAPATTALAISRFAPIDVKPAAALETRPVSRHITSTYDGLEVDVSAYREPDGFYVTLRAVEAGEGARRAETINTKAEGWAFKLTEFDWNEFTPPVRSLIVRSAPTSAPSSQ